MKGTLPDKMKKLMHRVGVQEKKFEYELEYAIVDLNSVMRPSMILIDGFIANEGYEPGTPGIGGTPVAFQTVVAGFDRVAVDAVGAYVMGFDPGEVKHISYAGERKIGIADLDRIKCLGDSVENIRRHFKRPTIDGTLFDFKNLSIIVGQGCSGCREAILVALTGVSSSELTRVGSVTLVVGSDVGLPKQEEGRHLILAGNCSFRND